MIKTLSTGEAIEITAKRVGRDVSCQVNGVQEGCLVDLSKPQGELVARVGRYGVTAAERETIKAEAVAEVATGELRCQAYTQAQGCPLHGETCR